MHTEQVQLMKQEGEVGRRTMGLLTRPMSTVTLAINKDDEITLYNALNDIMLEGVKTIMISCLLLLGHHRRNTSIEVRSSGKWDVEHHLNILHIRD